MSYQSWKRRQPDTIQGLKRKIVGDSLEQKRDVEKLIKMVREDERAKADRSRPGKKAANEG